MNYRNKLKDKTRIIVKIGSSALTYSETEHINMDKVEKLVRILTDIRNQGKDVILVSSGAIAVGRRALGITQKPKSRSVKQACAAVGQARLLMLYQKLFAEYDQIAAQILITKHTMINEISRTNAKNTFNELFNMGVIPIVNENDTVSTDELDLDFGENDTLSALVAALVEGDLLILLSDIDGFYTDDPHKNQNARLIPYVDEINDNLDKMAKPSTGGSLGTGGMATKISAARIATASGADMVIANGNDIHNINRVLAGKEVGTLFKSQKVDLFSIMDYITTKQYPRQIKDLS